MSAPFSIKFAGNKHKSAILLHFLWYNKSGTAVRRTAAGMGGTDMDVQKLLEKMTAEEKTALVAGTDFMYTNPIPRLGIPSLRMADGPHGLRVQAERGDNGVTGSLPATAFPTAACTASGWNPENLRCMGRAIAQECRKYGVQLLLGPGANIKRNPLAGRNFEYFSEDPLLAGTFAAAEVDGIQGEGVGAVVKHFALNNSENYRFTGDSVADLRAMREIYLKVFEITVKDSRPAAVMCAYNKVNGEFCSQNKWLLTDVLRRDWGFGGAVMTDWGAMHDRVKSLQAGLDLEMPGDTAVCRKWIADGIAEGTLSDEDLSGAAGNVLRLVARYAGTGENRAAEADFAANDSLACSIAEDCAVLLKNDGVLPLKDGERVFAAGELFEKMRYQGAGSSMIHPASLTSPKAAFEAMGVRFGYFRGYAAGETQPRGEWIAEAVKGSEKYDTLLIFAGLTDDAESEGYDRPHMRLPENQLALIDALIKTGKKIVLVLFGGAPVELPFADRVSAILHMYLPGQSGGRACANLLYGRANPGGKLAETWPLSYADVPFGDQFGRESREVYRESIFVGYRYYASAGVPVRYPFGYGLSYTSFQVRDMQTVRSGEAVSVTCTVQNTGERRGSEVVQLYVRAPRGKVFRPLRELRAFQKVYLDAGESREVCLTVRKEDLRYFDIRKNDWVFEGGEYEFQICSDSNTVLLSERVALEGESAVCPYSEAVQRVYSAADFADLSDALFEEMSGRKLAPLPPLRPVTVESRFSELKEACWPGRLLFRTVLWAAKRQAKGAEKMPDGAERENKAKGALFLERILESNSLVSMSMCAGRLMPYNFAQAFAALANGHLFRGIRLFCAKIKAPALPKDAGKR